jgi:hypothetical protein
VIFSHNPDWNAQYYGSYFHIRFIDNDRKVSSNNIQINDRITFQLRRLFVDFEKVESPDKKVKIWWTKTYTDWNGPLPRILRWNQNDIGEVKILAKGNIILDVGIPLVLDKWSHEWQDDFRSKIKDGDWIKVFGTKLYGEYIENE